MIQTPEERNAELYDVAVGDWPGELAFYQRLLAAETSGGAGAVLEVACGTGRLALRLAAQGVPVVGLELSAPMLAVARGKSHSLPNPRWVQGDMRFFALPERFALAIIPGHSFQFMLTPQDQLACLACIKRHLLPGALLAVHLDHQDLGWLGALPGVRERRFEAPTELRHPASGRTIRVQRAWSYERATQTASVLTRREELGADGAVLDSWETGPVALHCVFRLEMEHLLARAGFQLEALYGDFFGGELDEASSEMLWLARVPRA